MKRALTLFSVLGLFFVSAGCKGGAADMVAASEAYAKAACECKDAACATKASEDYTKKVAEMKDLKPSEDEAKKIAEAATKATDCVTKAAMPAMPPTP